MYKRISVTMDEPVAKMLLDKKQDYEDTHGVELSISAFIAMLIRNYGKDD